MKYVYSVGDIDELTRYAAFAEKHSAKIREYIDYISKEYSVAELPEYIVFSNFDMATKVHSDIIIPAYTNEMRMVITPDVAVWKRIYLNQIQNYDSDDRVELIQNYYEKALGDNCILQILGHELAHQSELFIDDFNDVTSNALWFEEGMVEYISRKFFLTEDEYAEEKRVNQLLVELFEEQHSTGSVDDFGQSTYDGSYASIFYEYWRSFLLVDKLVHKHESVEAVFEEYLKWHKEGRSCLLSDWFNGT